MVSYNVKILDMPVRERPRERLSRYGSGALSDAELIALILRTGTKNGNAVNMANEILKRYDLKRLSQVSFPELTSIAGIKKAKACQLLAAFELARRLESFVDEEKPVIKSSMDAYSMLGPKLRNLKKEHFLALYLNTKNALLKEDTVSVGSLTANIIHPRELFKTAVLESAASVILAHNHPSGDPSPSRDDIALTKRLAKAGELLGIALLDHVIIGDGKFISMKERGLM